MQRSLIAIVTIACLTFATQRLLVAAQQSSRVGCTELASLRLPDVRIEEAVAVPAATTGAIRVAHCRVTGVIGTEIRFALLLPETWNQKFFMGGGGGFVGSIQNSAQFDGQSGVRDRRHRHRAPGGGHRCELGSQQPRAPGELRLPRGSSHL